MPSIASVAIAVPKYRYPRSEIIRAALQWLDGDQDSGTLFEKFMQSCSIDERRFVLPLEEILALKGQSVRASVFAREGRVLGEKSAQLALERSGLKATDIGAFVFASCTSPLIPTIDTGIA